MEKWRTCVGGSASAHWPHLESFLRAPFPIHPLPDLKQDLRPDRTDGAARGFLGHKHCVFIFILIFFL